MLREHTPFTFGTIMLESDFVNRKKDIELLKNHFISGVNTIVISPRRWGKSSLIEKVSASFSDKKEVIICKLDLFDIRSEDEFYVALANVVLKETASKWDEFASFTKAFLSQLLPKISLGDDAVGRLSFGISLKELQRNPEDILNLAEKIAEKKNIRIVICVDEFQNIETFADSLAFQKKLRANFQRHSRVSYCLYGSKRHMLMEVFTNVSMPFYKFGTLLFLEKIETKDWVPFIVKRFSDYQKEISDGQAKKIVKLVNNHSYYVQQLAQQVWLRTNKKCTEDIVDESHRSLVNQLNLLFVTLTEGLSNTQIYFLKAFLSGEKHLTSKEVLNNYRLGTSANSVRLRRTLVQNDILDDVGGQLTFQDPVYEYWLKNDFFKIKNKKHRD